MLFIKMKILCLILIPFLSFSQIGLNTSILNKQSFYGFNLYHVERGGVQEVHYSLGYATNTNSDFINIGVSGKHGLKFYWGLGFSGTVYRFSNKFNQTILSTDPVMGYHFKRFNIETGYRLRLQNFGEATQVKHVPFISIGLR